MKQSLTTIAIVLLGIFFIAGCSSSPSAVDGSSDMSKEFEDAPEWVLNGGSNIEGGLAGVGSAKIGQAGVGFARTEAMAMARDELARQIEVKVKNLTKNFTQQIGVGDDQTVDKVAVQVSKQVTRQSISGSRQEASWISPSSTLYMLVTVDPESVQKYVKDSVQTSMKNEKALWQKFQAKKGFEDLDEEIQKEFGEYTSQQ
ncbi:MAG: LPP20 family lipoprotein [Thermodesulfobacteriota bacterium]